MNSGSENHLGTEPRHPIQVVARRTGLTPDALRAWEKRYHTVTPGRHGGGRRLYSDADIERLSLLRRATSHGRRIGDIASLTTEDLREMVAQDDAAARQAPAGPARETARTGTDSIASLVHAAKEAVQALDAEALDRTLARARALSDAVPFVDAVISPFLSEIGALWERGEVGVANEHLASASVRTLLGRDLASLRVPVNAPVVIVTTPAGQRHELGALMASVTALAAGWRAIYLGASLPAAEIAAAATRQEARAVALSLIHPDNDPLVGDELLILRRLLPPSTAVLVGGRALAGYAAAIASIGAITLDSYAGLARELIRLRV